MVVVPLSQSAKENGVTVRAHASETANWTRVAAAGAIVAGGLLLLTGWRRAGLITAASGTIVTLLDQKDTVRTWWTHVPGFIEDFQRMLAHVESTVQDIDSKRETLRQILSRRTSAGS
jgi:hypothetical protein